jgi:hypothetical protein
MQRQPEDHRIGGAVEKSVSPLQESRRLTVLFLELMDRRFVPARGHPKDGPANYRRKRCRAIEIAVTAFDESVTVPDKETMDAPTRLGYRSAQGET